MENNNKERSILFINQSSGYLMMDIIRAFELNYSNISLAAGLVNPRNNPIGKNVKVEKLMAYQRNNAIARIWTWGIAFLQCLWLVRTKYRNAELFIVSNPPLASLLPLFCKNRFSLLVYDIYPETLIEYGLLSKKSLIVRAWYRGHRKVFLNAKYVFTINDKMKEILKKYKTRNEIMVVPIWTDNSFLKPIPKHRNEYRMELDIQDYFVVGYSGNLGRSHDLDFLVELAKELRNSGVFVLVMGGGDQFRTLEKKIDLSGLNNIRLLPWQPTERLPQSLSAADLGVVSLGKEASSLSMPSKTYNLLSVGCPILAIAEPDTELASFVKEHEVGEHFQSGEIDAIIEYILQLKSDLPLQNRLHENALKASLLFSPDNAKKFILDEQEVELVSDSNTG